MRLHGRTVFTLVLLAAVLVLLVTALGYKPRARLVPLVVGVPTAVLAVVQVLVDGGVWGKKAGTGEGGREGKAPPSGSGGRPAAVRYAQVLVWMAILVALLYLVGFLITVPVFIFLYLRLVGKEGWPLALGIPLVAEVVFYLAFVQGLGIRFYEGILF